MHIKVRYKKTDPFWISKTKALNSQRWPKLFFSTIAELQPICILDFDAAAEEKLSYAAKKRRKLHVNLQTDGMQSPLTKTQIIKSTYIFTPHSSWFKDTSQYFDTNKKMDDTTKIFSVDQVRIDHSKDTPSDKYFLKTFKYCRT